MSGDRPRNCCEPMASTGASRPPVSFWKALYFLMRAMHIRRLTNGGMPDKAHIDQAHAERLPLVPAIAWEAAKQLRTRRVTSYLSKNKKRWWGR